MLFGDWILPFVYNIQFTGFQASVLLWTFLGGLVTLEQVAIRLPPAGSDHRRDEGLTDLPTASQKPAAPSVMGI
jgi:hypothetical protein